jgi:cytochrome c oxidase cbb3-type subunit 3
MKSISNKKMLLTGLLLSNAALSWSANGSAGIQVGDTLIFTLFVVCAIIFLMIIYAQINAVKGILENKDIWTEKADSKRGKGAKAAGMVILALALGQSAFAQTATTAPLVTMSKELYWILIGVNAFLLGIIITLYYVIKGIVSSLRGEDEKQVDTISQITSSLTDAVPIERESEILMDHDYDGIRELDNNLPPWWKYGFYLTIVFAFIYLIHFHLVGSGDLQLAEYSKEMARAEVEKAAFQASQANLVDESNLTVLTEDARIAAGKKVFMDNCKICHGEFGEGMVGPNFTDKYWKHGGSIANIYNTIKVGVPDKGMISWASQLTPGQIHEVASYILTLQGTNPPNPKAPEGDLWEGDATPAAPAESTDGNDNQENVQATEEKA